VALALAHKGAMTRLAELKKLSKEELQRKLAGIGEDPTGSKQVLIARLMEKLPAEPEPSAAAVKTASPAKAKPAEAGPSKKRHRDDVAADEVDRTTQYAPGVLEGDPGVLLQGTNVLVMDGPHTGKGGGVEAYDEGYDLYDLEVPGEADPILVPRHHLLPLYGVELIGLEGRPELNGSYATVERWLTERRRYEVSLASDDSRLALQPKNVLLPAGARVKLDGLVNACKYNGKLARVLSHDSAAGRYEVDFVNDEDVLTPLRVKRENVLLF